MSEENYKKETFIDTGSELFITLDKIAIELEQNMRTSNRRYKVSDILDTGKNAFHKLWPDVIPNNTKNKYSKNEFKGLYAYAIIENDNVYWQYIGVSKTIKQRLREHTLRKTKNSATWAYLMRKSAHKIKEIQQQKIHPCYFTFIKIEDNMLLHIAEAYCVSKFKAIWNSFETH